jgi:hypothetical protein
MFQQFALFESPADGTWAKPHIMVNCALLGVLLVGLEPSDADAKNLKPFVAIAKDMDLKARLTCFQFVVYLHANSIRLFLQQLISVQPRASRSHRTASWQQPLLFTML